MSLAAFDSGCTTVDLSIIVINWNSVGFLGKCLASVYENAGTLSLEVIVVDNASYDGCADLLSREFPQVRFIQSDRNLGFAKGNNLAAAEAAGRVLLFLNSDTEVVGNALQTLLASVDADPRAGAVGPMLLNSDRTVQTTCIQSYPSILNQLLAADWLRTRFPRWRLWGIRALSEAGAAPVRVEGISGACLMIRRADFEAVGGFNPAYFMYAEDMDLCYKVQAAGRINFYVSAARVVHHGGQSTEANADRQFSAVMMKESLFGFMRTYKGAWYAGMFRSTTGIAALCRLAVLAPALIVPLPEERRRRVSLAMAKWRRILRWSLGREPWVKQAS